MFVLKLSDIQNILDPPIILQNFDVYITYYLQKVVTKFSFKCNFSRQSLQRV